MSAARVPLLRLLAVAGEEGAGTAALARALGVDPAGVTRALAALVADGLAERRPHATDGRRALFVLTAEGGNGSTGSMSACTDSRPRCAQAPRRTTCCTAVEVLAAVRAAASGTEGT